jgi:hypothetical protein
MAQEIAAGMLVVLLLAGANRFLDHRIYKTLDAEKRSMMPPTTVVTMRERR